MAAGRARLNRSDSVKVSLERKTKRLHVRALDKRDFEAWRSIELLPKQNRWDRGPREKSEQMLGDFTRLLRFQKSLRDDDNTFHFAIFERPTGAIVGNVSIMQIARSLSQTAFLGYFVNNTHWGKGYGKEATLALIDIAFRDLKLHRVEAGVEPGNRRSIALARSLGLRKEGLKKRCVFLRDEWVDLIMYSATCEEFGILWDKSTDLRPS
jgi:ribosomal-protein-alanine N-acetyltransferase